MLHSDKAKLVDHCRKTLPSRKRRGFDDEAKKGRRLPRCAGRPPSRVSQSRLLDRGFWLHVQDGMLGIEVVFDHVSLLICVGDPRKGGSRLSFLLLVLVVARAWWAVGPVGVTVERPQRSEENDLDAGADATAYWRGRARVKALRFKPCEPPRAGSIEGGKGRASAQPYLGPRTRVRRHDDGWGARRTGCQVRGRSFFPGRPPRQRVATGALLELAAGIS